MAASFGNGERVERGSNPPRAGQRPREQTLERRRTPDDGYDGQKAEGNPKDPATESYSAQNCVWRNDVIVAQLIQENGGCFQSHESRQREQHEERNGEEARGAAQGVADCRVEQIIASERGLHDRSHQADPRAEGEGHGMVVLHQPRHTGHCL